MGRGTWWTRLAATAAPLFVLASCHSHSRGNSDDAGLGPDAAAGSVSSGSTPLSAPVPAEMEALARAAVVDRTVSVLYADAEKRLAFVECWDEEGTGRGCSLATRLVEEGREETVFDLWAPAEDRERMAQLALPRVAAYFGAHAYRGLPREEWPDGVAEVLVPALGKARWKKNKLVVRGASCRVGDKPFVKATVPLAAGSVLVPHAFYEGRTAPDLPFVVFEIQADSGDSYTEGKNHPDLFAVVDATPTANERKVLVDQCQRTCASLVRCQLETDPDDCANGCANDAKSQALFECLCRAKTCADMQACGQT